MKRTGLSIQGMSCGHCVAAVRRALEAEAGVQVEEVGVGMAQLAFDPARTSVERLMAAIEAVGYSARPVAAQR